MDSAQEIEFLIARAVIKMLESRRLFIFFIVPVAKYKLMSVTTDSFQGATRVDMRVYMVGAPTKTEIDIRVSPEVSRPKWRLVQM